MTVTTPLNRMYLNFTSIRRYSNVRIKRFLSLWHQTHYPKNDHPIEQTLPVPQMLLSK